jgi:hypothetical protein
MEIKQQKNFHPTSLLQEAVRLLQKSFYVGLEKYYPSLYEMEVAVKITYNRLQKLQVCSMQNLTAAVVDVCDASTCLAVTRQDHSQAANWSSYMLLNTSLLLNVITIGSVYIFNMAVLIKQNSLNLSNIST